MCSDSMGGFKEKAAFVEQPFLFFELILDLWNYDFFAEVVIGCFYFYDINSGTYVFYRN